MSTLYFSYDPIDDEFNQHNTLEEAKEKAEFYLDFYKGEAHDSGWPDGVEGICYGDIKGATCSTLHEYRDQMPEEEWASKYGITDFDEIIEYEVKEI